MEICSKERFNFKSISISMAALIFFALLLFPTVSSASRPSDYNVINEVCKASREPSTCQASLSHVPPNATVLQALGSALGVCAHNLNSGRRMVQDILDASAQTNLNRSIAARTCLELLRYSEHRMNLAADALPRGKTKDARAWMSAAMVYQYDCWSALKYVNATSLVNSTMAFFYSPLITSSSNALGMMLNYDIFGEKTASWGPPKTERDGFWEPGSASPGSGSVHGGVPSGLKADATVCKGCEYGSVQQAVDAAPENRAGLFVIRIKTGVYAETVRVPLEKKNVVFIGDGMGKTVITGSMNVGRQQGMSTFNSATVGVIGDGFMASNLTIQNTAGADAHQAVAFRSDSDLSVIENCEFLGNQDTLYSHSLRQYYKSCRIQGNVDFIFGNSAAFFEDCTILVAPRVVQPEKGETNAVSAHGRIDPAQSTGFVFQNCVINGTDAYMALYYSRPSVHKSFLGKPWKEYSRAVFIGCTLEALVNAEGWVAWSGDFALRTLYYGEFRNTGPGSDASERVTWSSQIPAERVCTYSVQNFIQGDEWIPPASS